MSCFVSINSIFAIPGQGAVLHGELLDGTIRVGQKIAIVAPAETVESRVRGLEIDNELVDRVSAVREMGLLIDDFNPEELASGITFAETGEMEVVNLKIEPSRRSWWQFWL